MVKMRVSPKAKRKLKALVNTGVLTRSMTKAEKVNHPKHYGGENNPYEAIKVIEAWKLNFNIGNAVKYIARAMAFGGKGATLEDLKKARWYLDREITNRGG